VDGVDVDVEGRKMRVMVQRARAGRRFPARRRQERRGDLPAFSGIKMKALRESLFEEDVILPEQYFARLRQKGDFPAEQRLLFAVLEDAVHCFQANLFARTVRRQQAFEEAEQWLLEPEMDATVTLEYVCDVFGFDAEYVRTGLRQWRDRQRATEHVAAVVPTTRRDELGQPAQTPLQLAVGA
jgi:hypothetical protein